MVLNAKFHESRGRDRCAGPGGLAMVTIATNMAGRGTDILLGGNADFMAKQELAKSGVAKALSTLEGEIEPVAGPGFTRFYYSNQEYEVPSDKWAETIKHYEENTQKDHDEVVAAGGLHIIGTERHESRRVDNQLRGRAGRQGDPGDSRFFLSLEDDLMRIFAKEWVGTLLQRMGMQEGEPIESGMITNRIAGAQKAVETQNFESRKHVLEYDDVMNKQREAVYGLRHSLLEGIDQKELILEDYTATELSNILDADAPEKVHPDQWKIDEMKGKLADLFGTDFPQVDPTTLNRHELGETLFNALKERFEVKETILSPDTLRYHERVVMLTVLDGLWKDHLLQMDHLKEGIGLRGYAQQDPLVAYKRESFDMFEVMMSRFQQDTLRNIFRMQILAPNGTPIESLEQLHALQQAGASAQDAIAPPMPSLPQNPFQNTQENWLNEPATSGSDEGSVSPFGNLNGDGSGNGQNFAPSKGRRSQKPKRTSRQ